MNTDSPFTRLLGSTKFLVMLIAIVAVVTLAALGRYSGDQAVEFVKWIVATWLASQAVQTSAEKVGVAFANRKASEIPTGAPPDTTDTK